LQNGKSSKEQIQKSLYPSFREKNPIAGDRVELEAKRMEWGKWVINTVINVNTYYQFNITGQ
jgi:hypothetical protein